MAEPRKSTVYDYSDLRLHPDGTRVYQKLTNLRPKLTQCTVQDARSNWIATDAGGSAKVPLFVKKKRTRSSEEYEEKEGNITAPVSEDGGDSCVQAGDDMDKKGKGKAKRPDHRKAKRQRFLKSDDFLASESTPSLAESSDMPLPYPSPVRFVFLVNRHSNFMIRIC
jgi:hypothetical protein